MVKRGHEVDLEYSKKEIMDKMNNFFGYTVVEKLKFISFDDAQTKFKKIDENKNHVTNSKYSDRVKDIKNDKIRNSLLELTKLFKVSENMCPFFLIIFLMFFGKVSLKDLKP